MITINDILRTINDKDISQAEKRNFIEENKLTIDDIIDAINYVTIERNFYRRRCSELKQKTT